MDCVGSRESWVWFLWNGSAVNPREMRECKKHGMTEFASRENGKRWRCVKCLKTSVSKRRKNLKLILVEEAGNQCLDCGYTGPPFMFDFDHRDPSQKKHRVSTGETKSLVRLRKEAEKCDLVCAMCHRMRTHKQRCKGCQYCV